EGILELISLLREFSFSIIWWRGSGKSGDCLLLTLKPTRVNIACELFLKTIVKSTGLAPIPKIGLSFRGISPTIGKNLIQQPQPLNALMKLARISVAGFCVSIRTTQVLHVL